MPSFTHLDVVEEMKLPRWSGEWGQRFIGIVVGVTNDMLVDGASIALMSQFSTAPEQQPLDALNALAEDCMRPHYSGETYAGLRSRVLGKWRFWTGSPKKGIVSEFQAAGISASIVVPNDLVLPTFINWNFDGVDDSVLFGNFLQYERTNAFSVSGWIQTGYPGTTSSWVFDAVDDAVSFGNVLDKDRFDAFSFGAYAKCDASTGQIIHKYDTTLERGYRLFISAGQLFVRIENHDSAVFNRISVRSTSATFADNVERHYFATYDGSGTAAGVKLWVNGVQITTAIEAGGDTLTATTLSSASLMIGQFGGGTATIKHASFWARELLSAEVAQIGPAVGYPDLTSMTFANVLQAWWKIDGSDSVKTGGVVDHSGNGLSGSALNGLGSAPLSVVISNSEVSINKRGWAVYMSSDGLMHFNLTNVDNVNELDVSIQPPVNDGKLHHFTFSYSGGSNPASVRGWIDKVESVVTTQSNTLSATIVNAGNELRLGRYGADAIRFWKGVIHHISVWDVVFDQSKVNSVYGDGLTRPDLSALSFVANLDAWWKLDDTDVTGASGIADYGPSNIDGTAQGGLGKSAAQIDYWSRFWVRFPFGTHPVVGGGATVGVAVVGTSRMGPIGLDSEAGELYLRTIQTITKRYKPFRWVPWDFEFEYASGKYLRLMGHKRYNDPLYVYQDP